MGNQKALPDTLPIDSDQFDDVKQAGPVASHAQTERTLLNYAMAAGRGGAAGAKDFAGGIYDSLLHPINTGKGLVKQVKDFGNAMVTDQPESSWQGHMLHMAENLPVVGGYVKQSEQAGQPTSTAPDTANGGYKANYASPESIEAGTRAATSMAILPKTAMGVVSKARQMANMPKPIEIPPAEQTSRTLATRLTNSAKDAPGVTSTVGNQLDTLKKFAPEGISRKQGLLDLSKTAGKAAEADPYLSDYIEPNKDAPVGNSGMTVGQAHSRLAQINDTLHPKYMRGGSGSPSAQAAIGAEQASALEGEANSLRQGIADTVGKRMGIDPDYVRGLRKNYEQLKDIGWRSDVADYAHQMGLKDPAIPTSKMGIVERGYNRFFNNPNSGVAKAFNGYEASPTPEPPGYPLTGPSDVLKPLAQHPLNPQPLEHANFEPRDVSADSRAYLDEAARRRESRPEPAPLAKVPTTRPDVTDQPIKVSEPMDNSAESKQYLDEAARRRNGKPKSATKEK